MTQDYMILRPTLGTRRSPCLLYRPRELLQRDQAPALQHGRVEPCSDSERTERAYLAFQEFIGISGAFERTTLDVYLRYPNRSQQGGSKWEMTIGKEKKEFCRSQGDGCEVQS